jgi:hypothetical protein
MSVPLVHHLKQLSTYVTVTVRVRNFYPSSSRTNLQLDKKMYCRSGLLLACVFHKKSQKKKNLSFFSPGMPQPKKRKYREDMVAIHK